MSRESDATKVLINFITSFCEIDVKMSHLALSFVALLNAKQGHFLDLSHKQLKYLSSL
jgi:hypothetical protein